MRFIDWTVSPGRDLRVLPCSDAEIILQDDARSSLGPMPFGCRDASLRATLLATELKSEREASEMSAALPIETAAVLSDARVLLDRTEPIVAARDITRRYGSGDTAVDALRGVSLDVDAGELLAVMGPSGSGKSTLMHILAGLDQPSSGWVEIVGRDITKMSDNELTKLRRAHIGFVFQFFNLLPMLTAEENATLPLRIAGAKVDGAWLQEVLDQVGLTERRTHRPAQLSGGQQQRVAIARALLSRPSVLFADEPTGNLDSQTSSEILDVLREAVESYGQTTIMVTHDANAAAIADRILFLADGRVVRELGRSSATEVLGALREVTNR
jgi:putative ABC transport system ATP-binding protein